MTTGVDVRVTFGEGEPSGVTGRVVVDVGEGDVVSVGVGVGVVVDVGIGVPVEIGDGDLVAPGEGLGSGVCSDSSVQPANMPTNTTRATASSHLCEYLIDRVVS